MSAIALADDIVRIAGLGGGKSLARDQPSVAQDATVRILTTALRDQATPEEDKLRILQALRAANLAQSHELILNVVTSTLCDPSLFVREKAVLALLTYADMATTSALLTCVNDIVTTASRSLVSLETAVYTAPGIARRLVRDCFQLLNTLVAKVPGLSVVIIDKIVTMLAAWVYHGPTKPGTDNLGITFGVMSSFAQPNNSPKKKKIKGSFVGTSPTPSTERDSTMREAAAVNPKVGAAQIRIASLTCLLCVAKASCFASNRISNESDCGSYTQGNPKALHKHWHHFLSDSPYLPNRLTLIGLVKSDLDAQVRGLACDALEAMLVGSAPYLAIARDRPAKAAFISLSTKMGEIVSELHISITHLLQQPFRDKTLDRDDRESRVKLLKLASRLASCSPYGRMKRPIVGPLANALLYNIEYPDDLLVAAAVTALSVLLNRYKMTASEQPLDLALLADSMEKLLKPEIDMNVESAVWSMLGHIVLTDTQRNWSTALGFLGTRLDKALRDGDDDSETDEVVSKAADANSLAEASKATFVISFFNYPESPSETPKCDAYMHLLLPILQQLLYSRYLNCRELACRALHHPSLVTHGVMDVLSEARTAATCSDHRVARAGTRAIGLILRNQKTKIELTNLKSADSSTLPNKSTAQAGSSSKRKPSFKADPSTPDNPVNEIDVDTVGYLERLTMKGEEESQRHDQGSEDDDGIVEVFQDLGYQFQLAATVDSTWALANACDTLDISHAKYVDFTALIDRSVIVLSNPKVDEGIFCSCLRILGSMLRLMSANYKGNDSTYSTILDTFLGTLSSKSAKKQVRWNTCTALNSSLSQLDALVFTSPSFVKLHAKLVHCLGSDPSYKVRIHATVALTQIVRLHDSDNHIDDGLVPVLPIAQEAKVEIARIWEHSDYPLKEKMHVEGLLAKVRQSQNDPGGKGH
ncbi:uncharacterized protein JCM15063_003786 [Sporobolomyces koalae]|uniref:uncharacterized protein n=1 Tax=Sporobolomyces koalae TaxID=500713 RepID=UPI00317F1266